jgi:hypothetical protein
VARQHDRTVPFRYPYGVVLDAFAQALPPAGFRVSTVDPGRGMVFAVRGTSAWSWGENVTVQLGQPAPDQPTEARIHSALAFGLVDWGRNRKNIDLILTAVTGHLDQYAGPARLPD